MMNTPLIQVRDLVQKIGGQEILKGISLDIHKGETLALLGKSGGGKSVFLRHLIGLMRPVSGSILFEEKDVTKLKERELEPVRKKIGMLFQDGALFDSMNVFDNVAFPLRERGERNPAVVRGATAALMRGFRDTLRNGQEMLDNLKRVEPLTDVALERERHEMNVARVIMSDNVRANGLSSVDMGRLQTGIRAVEEAYNLPPRVQAAQIYTPEFLPAAADRAV
jgi:ABC-type sugar transport system ATPase subunit